MFYLNEQLQSLPFEMHLLPMGLNILHAQFDFPTCIFIKMWTSLIVSSVLQLHFENILYFKGTSLLSRGEGHFPVRNDFLSVCRRHFDF